MEKQRSFSSDLSLCPMNLMSDQNISNLEGVMIFHNSNDEKNRFTFVYLSLAGISQHEAFITDSFKRMAAKEKG